MAKKKSPSNSRSSQSRQVPKKKSSSSTTTNTFSKGMNKDVTPSFEPNNSWYHAINAANNSSDGDVGVIGNEPANLQCGVIPYTIIGAIHRYGDEWIVYSTDNISSEIGRFDDSECKYTVIVNDPCLNFKKKFLITGAAKENFDCTWQVYWDDGNNPSRSMNIDDVPYLQDIVSAPGDSCIVYEDTTFLDCEKIRLHPLVDTPCLSLTKATDGGTILNGAYQAFIAYTENDQVVSDYIGISNIQTLWSHRGSNSSLDLEISRLDKDYYYFDLVILIRQQGQIYTKLIGNYSTETKHINIDYIDQALVSISFEELFRQSPLYEKSEAMYVVNDYLIRQGPTEQFDFNYQPLANNIKTNWVINEVSQDYYINSGNKLGLMRDEQYAFFIRWIYNTGERSSSYHIPGRASRDYTLPNGSIENERTIIYGTNVLDNAGGEPLFKVYNTATGGPIPIVPQPDGSNIIARGEMGYWESTEKYPDKTPEIWNSSSHTWSNEFDPGADLCGEFIRHHKMPSEMIDPILSISDNNDSGLHILGVEFSNIKRPMFNDGTPILNIQGYEILRGSRLGNKTILAKGMFKNMRKYDVPAEENLISNAQGLYPNYPYNDLRCDVYHTTHRRTEGCSDGIQESVDDYNAVCGFTEDVFTFHSPDLMFTKPYLNAYETVFYGQINGKAAGGFIPSEKHPQQKLLRNITAYLSAIIGIGYALKNINGTPDTKALPVQAINNAFPEWLIKIKDTNISEFLTATVVTPTGGGTSTDSFNSSGGGTDNTGDNNTNNQKGDDAETGANEAIDNYVANQGGGPFGGLFGFLEQLFLGGASDILGAFGVDDTLQKRLQDQAIENISATTDGPQNGMGLMGGGAQEGVTLDSSESNLSQVFRIAMSTTLLQKNIAVGGQEIIDLIYNLSDFQEHTLKYNSHGFYSNFSAGSINSTYRTLNKAANYVGSSFQTFDQNQYKINNLFRPSTVAVSTTDPIDSNLYAVQDDSRFTLGGYCPSTSNANSGVNWGNTESRLLNPEGPFGSNISALYGALKFNMDNQYGQLDGIKQIQMRGCVEFIDQTNPPNFKYTSEAIFSGDVFIGRYTEKCIMPLFTDFLIGQYDGYPYDYFLRYNIPYPRFWVDSRKFDLGGLAELVSSFGLSGVFNPDAQDLPNEYYYLDRGDTCGWSFLPGLFNKDALNSTFAMNHAYMYTHINGINDFYVETEVNIAYRDWEEPKERRFYDTYEYNNLQDLFHAEIQQYDNFYKYDESLSPSKFITQNTNFAEIQQRDYNPLVAETCYTAYPKRLIYSLQANEEDRKDYWRQYLFANYKDFKNRVSVIKPYSKSGAIIFFPYQSPQVFEGYDTLKTDANTKITIGDGGLFTQKLQNIVNSDLSNEYGSLENQRGIINTPAGLFYISQAQGKIFQFTPGRGLNAISNAGMKWWFNKYLPSRFVKQFPTAENTEWADNPVVGVGCQVMYDPNDDIVYFMKKDYSIKPEWVDKAVFTDTIVKPISIYGTNINPKVPVPIDIGDPIYFNDCSWTISYDVKAKAWISFHDWHPEFALPSINHFFTTKTILTDEPQCPPGYTFNPTTGLCEDIINITEPRAVVKTDIPADISGGPEDCLIDLVVTMDASGSTLWPGGNQLNGNVFPSFPSAGANTRGQALIDWLVVFIDDPAIQNLLTNGTLQVGFRVWATGSFQGNPTGTGESMLGAVTGAQAATWFVNNWTNQNGIAGATNAQVARDSGITQLNDKANSNLSANYPARSTDPNFRQILIIATDADGITNGTDPINPSTFACCQSSNLIAGAGGPINQEIYSVYVGNTSNVPTNSGVLNQFTVAATGSGIGPANAYYNNTTNTPGLGQFTMAANNPAELQSTAAAVAADICSTPYSCSCPSGYTLVYPNPTTGFWTEPTGTCTDVPPAPICREVVCPDCPPGPTNTTTTTLGSCPDTFPELGYIGDPNWVDPTPPLCNYYYADFVQANYLVGSFWRHNVRCDLFANYYGESFPWEVELISNTGQTVNTIRSIEYQLETYVYKGEPEYNMCGGDKWEDLLFNFDKSIIYNNDQVSGLLNITSQPFNDPWNELTYPIITANDMTVLASKVEHKFRINQFWDITNDRGEFTNAEQAVFDTQCNGYIRPLNQTNLNYFKPETQRKKFRHYSNHVLLRRQESGNRKMLLRLENTKLLLSMR
tara:strand:+ start:8672 stop:15175 length:6504 start_codon:yes stop_codon:yes gene_type:complete